ncbi:unnamed protein product [Victoria cruziana]
MASAENVEPPASPLADKDHNIESLVPPGTHIGNETPRHNISDEVRSIIEVIAATGKYWHDWDVLKIIISFRLKQALIEYPEREISSDGGPYRGPVVVEKHSELVERLNDALLSFTGAPPFTLQRLCEILLTPRSMYPSLSKLVLALEKNLLVTSTIPICTDPYPSSKPAAIEELVEELKNHPPTLTEDNGENLVEDADVEMADEDGNLDNKMAASEEEKKNEEPPPEPENTPPCRSIEPRPSL